MRLRIKGNFLLPQRVNTKDLSDAIFPLWLLIMQMTNVLVVVVSNVLENE